MTPHPPPPADARHFSLDEIIRALIAANGLPQGDYELWMDIALRDVTDLDPKTPMVGVGFRGLFLRAIQPPDSSPSPVDRDT
jgi:hypothetical protein